MLNGAYYARQPIFDRRRVVAGYELLYRAHGTGGSVGGAGATAAVLANAFAGLEGPGVDTGLPWYVNLPDELLRGTEILGFSPSRIVIEVLEDVSPDSGLIVAIGRLRAAGYTVALDDYVVGDHRRPLLGCVDLVKVDMVAVGPGERGPLVRSLRLAPVRLLAEKVETPADLAQAIGLGFDLYQGYFFARPELVAVRRLDEGRGRLVRLLAELQDPDIGLDRVASSVEGHPRLSFQLLTMLNSAHIGLPHRVASIREAVVMLGTRRITDLTAVLVMAAGQDKPRELISLGLSRGKLCEHLAGRLGAADPASAFTAGVFSVFDALTDVPMEALVAPLPLHDTVKAALVERSGPIGEILDAAVSYERARWEVVDRFSLEPAAWSESYLDALTWAGQQMAML